MNASAFFTWPRGENPAFAAGAIITRKINSQEIELQFEGHLAISKNDFLPGSTSEFRSKQIIDEAMIT